MKKSYKDIKIHLKTILIFMVLLVSCQPSEKPTLSPEISPQEREWLTKFFSDIMIFERGIYTLWGAHKPMTILPMADYSEKELKARYESLSEEEKKKNNECFKVEVIDGYAIYEAWKKWEQISHRFPMKRFMLFKQESDDPHVFSVIFVDIVKTASVIQDNYEAFREAIGFDFHPMEIVLQMNQKDSVFLENLNSYLYGLLFGFGKTNSHTFHWKYFDHPKSCDEFCKNIKSKSSNEQLNGEIKFTIDNLLLPAFASFNEFDDVVDQYKNERKKIKEIYKDRNFLDLTLQKLIE